MTEGTPPCWELLDADALAAAMQIAATVPTPLRELGPEVARKLFATRPAEHPITSIDVVESLRIPTRAGQVGARLYRRDRIGRTPALLYLHGGGFVLGTLDGVDELCRAIAARSGWAVISLDYRLAPEHRFPAALEDAVDAFTWLQESAHELNLDTIAVGGDSAGGNLAAALCLVQRDAGRPMPAAQVLAYPAVDDRFARDSWTRFADAPLLTAADAKWCHAQYVGIGAPGALAAPLRAESLHGLPPALVVTAEVDPIRDDAEAYADRLRAEGVSVSAIRFPGVFHGFFTEVGVYAKTDAAIEVVVEYLHDIAAARGQILVEAEEFDDFGGWILDSQFDIEMGSPYLLAHGLGVPVADATTTIDIETSGTYHVWVRSKDWVPFHHPGRFTVSVDGESMPTECGASGRDWSWENVGRIDLAAGPVTLTLTDLTGFDGRCDAIYLTTGDDEPPDGADARTWRRRLRGLPDEPVDGGMFDVVVAGGGVTGSAAALAAGRLGLTVALIQNRPVLGGNASVEIGLTPRGETGPFIKALATRDDEGDLAAFDLLKAEPTVSVFLEHQIYDVSRAANRITSIDARDARSGRETRFRGAIFIDCTGTAILGLRAGAETMFGYESRAEFDEPLAPDERIESHHGNTLFFRTRDADQPAEFPKVPWAVEVAKDFADLGGQLERPGIDNVAGPVAGPARTPDPSIRRRMLKPLTHFWEYGHDLDPYTDAEHIRDHLLRAIYGTFSNVKTLEPDTYANLVLDWVAHVPAQGEFRRYKGDYVLTENDIREHRTFADTVAWNSGAFCLHYPGHEKFDFRLRDWKWDTRDDAPFEVPFRCLYSSDIDNLMMAGKHISVTHIAGSVTKFMGNGGQHAIATAAAAKVCIEHATTPRGVYENHLPELMEKVAVITSSTVCSESHQWSRH